jgi:3-deoxy-manno-octulosonate cytidylyltransferase (CMP-KDO synthetase)
MSEKENKVIAVIPAHMASVRFPGKILFDIHGLPMIEHVRRRALFAKSPDDVIVATCDTQIEQAISGFGGKVIMTSDKHKNGSTRVAEAVTRLECTHVIVLQGDEPLMLPDHIDALVDSISRYPDADAWNATGALEQEDELDRHSFVKCAVTAENRILHCFRRSPCYSPFATQQKFIRKILGIFAFRKEFLLNIVNLPPSPIETAEFIEQMRILENGFRMQSVPVAPTLPSVNEPAEADIIFNYLAERDEQRELLERVLAFK